ncbi:Mob1/phocein family [Ceratobasidium sp. AG-Ba]|nr:Mob1/phocein family [Ceratobasidium sp. AG-Ba]
MSMSETKPARLRRGTTLEQVYAPGESISINHIDSAFQSQEYIAHLIRQDPHDVQRIVTLPKTSMDDDKGTVDQGSWLFEQLRRLAQDLTYPLITNLQLECTRDTCPEMKAGEWLYLCVAHGNNVGGHVQCCAIDYIVHTLDSATALLNSTRVFRPASRSHPRLTVTFRHLRAEAESSLYARFLALSQQNSLVPPELLVIPLEGLHGNHLHEQSDPTEDDGRRSVSPQTSTDNNGGTFLADTTHERPPQSIELYDDGSAGEGNRDSNDEDPEDIDLPEESETTDDQQHNIQDISKPTPVSHDDAGLTETHDEADRTHDLTHDTEVRESAVKEENPGLEDENQPVPSNGNVPFSEKPEPPANTTDEPRPTSPSENGGLVRDSGLGANQEDKET